MPKCEICGREFKSDHAVVVHTAIQHTKNKLPKKAERAAKATKAAKGTFVCKVCGREFNHPAHLGRHISVAHAKAGRVKTGRRLGRPPGRRAVIASVGVNVQSLDIDQLLTLKQQVDGRLTDIAMKMRAAKVGQ